VKKKKGEETLLKSFPPVREEYSYKKKKNLYVEEKIILNFINHKKVSTLSTFIKYSDKYYLRCVLKHEA
jgi:hypothetical protein